MATTTMRLGLILILSLAIIQISKAKSETEDQNELDQESEASMMVSSSEEAKIRNVREAGKNGNKLDRKEENAQKKKKKKKGGKARRKAGRRKIKVGRRQRKKGGKAGKGGKKPRNGAGRKRPRKGKKRNNNKRKSEKEFKKKKKKRRQNKNGKRQKRITKKKGKSKKVQTGIVRQGTCDEAKLCQKIKDYIKYSNQLRKVRRIVKSCDTMDKKATKAATEFSATVAALDQVISGNAKRQLYIRWRRTKRSTDEVVAIRDNLKNCSASAKAKCEKSVEPACAESAIHTECDAALEAWLKSFGPSKGSCLQASADCCACITALPEVDAKCLDFEAKSKAAVDSKKKCTGGTETGSFGFCRKQQQDASVKGPKAACGGSTATQAPGASTTKAATGASTAAQGGATTGANAATATTAASGSCAVKCGVKKQGTKIVGGAEASVNEYPWIAFLSTGCGGSIIADKWIVTAAHCFFSQDGLTQEYTNANVGDITIDIGEHDRMSTTESTITKAIKPNLIVIHPSYDFKTVSNDIALLRVPAMDLTVYTPVCLPTAGKNYDGKKAWVYGWGALAFQGESPSKLQELEISILSDAAAKTAYQNNVSPLTDAQLAVMVFAGGVKGKDACQGDSGGPFTYPNPDNNAQHELVGVVSWGEACGGTLPGAYSEVSAFRTWIDQELKKNGGATFTC